MKGKQIGTHKPATQNPPPKWSVCHNSDTQLASGLEQRQFRVLNIKREGRILELDSGDGVHCVRPAQRFRGAFGETDISNFARSGDEDQRLIVSVKDGDRREPTTHSTSFFIAPTVSCGNRATLD